jgi:hypothetical protein
MSGRNTVLEVHIREKLARPLVRHGRARRYGHAGYRVTLFGPDRTQRCLKRGAKKTPPQGGRKTPARGGIS